MAALLIGCVVVVCGAMVAWALRRPAGVYEYPFLAAATTLGFLMPQAIGLLASEAVPVGALESVLVVLVLSLLCLFYGYGLGQKRAWRWGQWNLDPDRGLAVATGLIVIGGAFYWTIAGLPEEMLGSQWSGLPVRYLFFATLLHHGVAVALLLTGVRRRWASALAVAGLSVLAYRAVFLGRRGVAVEAALMLLLALWFVRRWVLPRSAMLALAVVGALATFATGEYRTAVIGEQASPTAAARQVDWLDHLATVTREGSSELMVAAMEIEGVKKSGWYDIGAWHWNVLVFNYVPAQLVGEEVKASLMFDLPQPAYEAFGFEAPTGSTATGLADAFRSFWYLGAGKFFLIAFIMGRLWAGARESQVYQLLYMLLVTPSMLAITHHTQWFFSPMVHLGVFLAPLLLWARRRARGGRPSPRARVTPAMSRLPRR